MSIEEIISSGLLESYVLGITTDEETVYVQRMCKQYPELNDEIKHIEQVLITYSEAGVESINPKLRDHIKENISFNIPQEQSPASVIPLNAPSSVPAFYKIGMAASVLLLIMSSVYIYSLHQKIENLHTDLAELSTSKSVMADDLKIEQASYTRVHSRLQILSDPHVKTIALGGMNAMATKSALVHWNTETNEVYFNATAMPSAPGTKQYQLWAIVNGKPVDAGLIEVENNTAFQKMKVIKGAQAFAVTIENAGGSATPSMDTMCFLGNV